MRRHAARAKCQLSDFPDPPATPSHRIVIAIMPRRRRLPPPLWCVAILAVVASARPALANPADAGNWELTLAGIGTSNQDFDEHALGANIGVGYFVFDGLELSLRQTISYVTGSDSDSTDASTTVALDWHLGFGDRRQWQPFIGAHVGYYYGDTFSDTFEYGPEAGLKYFVNDTTFLYFRAEYQMFSDTFGGGGGSDQDRQFLYGVGIGFRF